MAPHDHPYPPPPPFAGAYRSVGVTGTNGKTTTTTWIGRALDALGRGAVVQTTVGVTVGGVPWPADDDFQSFLASLEAGHGRGLRHAALELSSQSLAAGFLRAWPFEVGVVTNVTRDHLDVHQSPEHYLASKAQLLLHLPPGGAAVVNADDPLSQLLTEVVPTGVRQLTFGRRSRAAVTAQLVDVAVSLEGTAVDLVVQGAPLRLRVAAVGEPFAENAAAALLAVMALGFPADAAGQALAEAPAPPGRFQIVGRAPAAVVDYAHTPDALTRTVATARAVTSGAVWLVVGAGGERDRDKRPLMGTAAGGADHVVLTSDNPRREDPAAIAAAMAGGLAGHPDVRTVLDREIAIRTALEEAGPNDLVLVAGRGHETHQEVGGRRVAFDDARVTARWASARRAGPGRS